MTRQKLSKWSYAKLFYFVIMETFFIGSYLIRNATRCLNQEGQHMKTDLQLLTHDEEDNNLYIHAFSALGFLLSSGTRVFGPIAIFPKTILHWNVKSAEHINEDSLALFPLLVPKLEIVVIGYGDKNTPASNTIFRYLKSHKINVEILPTDLACSTFNFLNLERRYVGAALIPPSYTSVRDSYPIVDNTQTDFPDIELDPNLSVSEGLAQVRQKFQEAMWDEPKRKSLRVSKAQKLDEQKKDVKNLNDDKES